jgi:hypothetical protein
MKFDNVSIVGVAHVDAPHRIPSEDLDGGWPRPTDGWACRRGFWKA